MITKKTVTGKLVYFLMHFVMILFSIGCIFPFILTFMVSISDEKSVINNGFKLIPDALSLAAYKTIFMDNTIFRAYGVTIFITIVGMILSVILTGMAGYALSVSKVKYRNRIALFFFIPMLFGAGLVPWYLVCTKFLMLKNHLYGLILPSLISPFNIFLMRNYFKTIPASLGESAEIDGATPFYTFIKIIMPLSTPIIATICLFVSLGYWNDWYLALWFMDKRELYPLQYMLFRINSLINFIRQNGGQVNGSADIPTQTFQVATLFVTIGPIILVYPFVQKYFIKGIMVGAVKG